MNPKEAATVTSANGVEASTAAGLSEETKAQLSEQEEEIKKLKADLARAKKNEKIVSGKLSTANAKAS